MTDYKETSMQAWLNWQGSAKSISITKKIYATIRVHSGIGGIVCDDVERIIGSPHQTVSSSITHLQECHLIMDSGNRGVTRYNEAAIMWVSVAPEGAPWPHVPPKKRTTSNDEKPPIEFSMTGHSAILGG